MFGARTLPETTLEEIANQVIPPQTKLRCSTDDIQVQFDGGNPSVRVRVGPEDHVSLPITGARHVFGQFLNIPAAFLDRVNSPMATYIVNGLLGEVHGEVNIRHDDRGIHDILEARLDPIEPLSVVEIAEAVVGREAKILEWWCSNIDFRLDVVSPDNGPVVRGDRKVGDICHGGLRYTQDLRKHMMPQVQKLIYRLVCTNGMECADATAKMDGRGASHEEFLTSFEVVSRRLYSEVEADIDHFYQLRDRPLGDASQAVLRVATEAGLPERVTTHLVRLVPDAFGDEPTQFDLVNLFTNAALEPGVPAGTRRRLEQAGGMVVTEQSTRCTKCAAKVG